MNTPQAIMAFSQSEKIKSALIWISQTLEMLGGLSVSDRQGGEMVVRAFLDMIIQEVQLARNVTGEEMWEEVTKHIDQASVMVNSGVASEAVYHLTQGLSQVTNLGHRSMTLLKEQGLL